MMALKKARKNTRKMEVPTDSPIEFELGDTVADIQRTMGREYETERGS